MKKARKASRDETGGLGSPSVFHATVVIFLEFFAWGLLTGPMITVLGETFSSHTLLMNGLVQGVKGFLSFLSAPLIGALSDVWGRKSFLLLSVFFTCLPIPLMKMSAGWYFAVYSLSGLFAVTFSVVFAYVADITDESERSTAYGQVSATFAASFVTSPALGAFLSAKFGDGVVVLFATCISVLDLLFILIVVPESLPERVRPASWGAPISWEQADPFQSIRKIGQDRNILRLMIIVFLSYLPEAGQYSCLFIYLTKVIGFGRQDVAMFIAIVGLLSVVAQTLLLGMLISTVGNRRCIIVGLLFQFIQLACFGMSTEPWMMWSAGCLAAFSAITYPAITALVSKNAEDDQQGAVQGIVTGIRGLCNGLGPAAFGLLFGLFHVDLTEPHDAAEARNQTVSSVREMPGASFLFGALLVFLAAVVTLFLRDAHSKQIGSASESPRKELLTKLGP
ncbi:hippocampus abundant transcript 1 protein-like [Oscarella lobularis]|uniref:hippocampus abundant transcript 1 protein-like n=1 Tax=Oscarella lobularis TaxID=121494 RepID=UPI0033137677